MEKPNYQELDGCHNCEFVFKKEEYDAYDEWFCNQDNSERPICGSVAMGEQFSLKITLENKEFEERYEEWLKWSEPREVRSWGKCQNYLRTTKNETKEN